MDLRTLVGSQIGDYHLKKLLGRGGMGAVFLGWHVHMQLPFAVKVLRPDLADDQTYLKRFFHEAHQGARLKHENIVTIHNAGMGDIFAAGAPPQMPFLAMEYVEGKNLLQVMKSQETKRLRPSHAVEIGRQALTGLDYAHREGMIHRDIKPENLLLTPANVVRITDFGLARGSDRPVDPEEAGLIMGTPEYMPVEQWAGRTDVDHRADIYAMGASLYHLLAGTPPFPGRTPIAIMKLVTAGETQAVELVAPDVDPMLSGIVHKMMAREADDRYQSAGQALAELERWMRLYEEGTLPGMSAPGSHAAAGFDLDELEGGANEILQGDDLPGLLPADGDDGPALPGYEDEESNPGKLSLEFADDTAPRAKAAASAPGHAAATAPSTKPSAKKRPANGQRAKSRRQSSPRGSQRPGSQRPASSSGSPRGSHRPKSSVAGSPRASQRPKSSVPAQPRIDPDDLPEPEDRPRRAFQLDMQRILLILLVVGMLVGGLLVLKQFGCTPTGEVRSQVPTGSAGGQRG